MINIYLKNSKLLNCFIFLLDIVSKRLKIIVNKNNRNEYSTYCLANLENDLYQFSHVVWITGHKASGKSKILSSIRKNAKNLQIDVARNITTRNKRDSEAGTLPDSHLFINSDNPLQLFESMKDRGEFLFDYENFENGNLYKYGFQEDQFAKDRLIGSHGFILDGFYS